MDTRFRKYQRKYPRQSASDTGAARHGAPGLRMAGASGLLRCYVLADCRAYGNKTPWPDAITHLSATAMPTKPGRAGCNTRWSATAYRNACASVRMPIPCPPVRSEEHTSELQSLMRNSYALFC